MVKRLECDVLCIGAGGAGLVAAVTAAEAGAKTIVLSKDLYGSGNTRISGGLVLRPNISPKDSPEALMRDMLAGGEFLNDQALVEQYCSRAYLATELMERYGLLFFRNASGKNAPLPVAMGGHSLPRTLTGYSEGIPIGTALRATAARAGVEILDETIALRLLQSGSTVTGVVCLQWLNGETVAVSARQTILATGGLGWLYYPHTSNTRSMTGDGYALALDAGAELTDMEQQQFLPFALTHPESMVGIVCGEPASAGPYGKLLDKNGKEILSAVRTKTRADVAAAMSLAKEHGAATEHGGMLLDLSPNFHHVIGDKMFAFLARTFPSMIGAVRRAYGDEAARGRIPWDVFPTAHYNMGGVRIDPTCRVHGVENLFAVGEVSGGLHGASRIGSTSLAELFTFGSMAGQQAAATAKEQETPVLDDAVVKNIRSEVEGMLGGTGTIKPHQLVRQLQKTMWQNVGPVRNAARLEETLRQIDEFRDRRDAISVSARRECNPEWLEALELDRMLVVAEAITRSAHVRRESRGGHFRFDHPARDDTNWLKNVIITLENGRVSTRTEDVSLSRFGLDTKGGPNLLRERIQFLILHLLPRKTQEKILDARLNLGENA
jgi:succinate dehydrogenase/fumarate reductase flavoprotein subunit